MSELPPTTNQLIALLARRYEGPAWTFLTNVRSDSDGKESKIRHADAMAMALWPSLDFELHGFEVKVSRADFLCELRDEDKSSQIKRYCDRWWLVIPDKEIVRLGGVPDEWGVLAPSRGSLRSFKKATKLSPDPISRGFLASLVGNARWKHQSSRRGNDRSKTNEIW